MSIYRSSSPSPYGPPSPVPSATGLPPSGPGGQIQPGTITYTTSTSPDGRLTYHPFKAVPVSYQTNSGIVSGIQWIPAEATSVIPAGAQPAAPVCRTTLCPAISDKEEINQSINQDFMSSWNRGNSNKDDKALREWQKDEERRIYKEEKEAKRMKKEKDRQARERDRAMSGSYSAAAPYGAGAYTNPMNDLERRMDNVDLSHGRKSSVGEYNSRRRSTYTEAPIAGQPPTSPYQPPIAPPSPIGTAANPGYAPAAGYGVSPYPPVGPTADPYQRAASPYHGAGPEQAILSRSRAPSPNPMTGVGAYGPRSRAPSPIPGAFGGPRSRAPSPNPNHPPYATAPQRPRSRAASPLPGTVPAQYGGPGYPQPTYPGAIPRSPHMGGGATLAGPEPPMLPPPDGFSRPANLAQSYTFFETMKIQDMDDFYDNIPRMPMVLVPHDVYHEDWIRLCQDVALAWGGKLPTTDPNRSSRPSTITAELVDLWNNSFFASRGVEVVLFKGHERRSGQGFGQIERNLPGFGDKSDSDTSDLTSSDSSDQSDDKYGRGGVVVAAAVAIMGHTRIRRGRRWSAKLRRSARTKRRRPVVVLVSAKEHTPFTSPALPRVTGPFPLHIS
ncbi:hypothetical protein EI94DRAFT_1197862 [Lactarius quietus]|nr:hypothetical protein EI94DRAFT_1197862 [Lactarius quietus]